MSNISLDRRKDSFIRTGNRFNFDRRDTYRLLINDQISVKDNTDKISTFLLNIDSKGACISSPCFFTTKTPLMNLNPYLDLEIQGKIIWQETNKQDNIFIYGIELINLTSEQTAYLKEILLLNSDFFIEHANRINSHVKNIELKNKIINFFIEDVQTALKELLKIEQNLKKDEIEPQNIKEYTEVLDNLIYSADKLVTKINDHSIEKKIKQRLRAIFGYILYKSEVMKRAVEKPRGYPGDCQMLEFVYNNVEVANTLVGRYLDRYYLDNPYAIAVRGRKDNMKNIIKKYLEDNTNKNLEILNLASGSLREIRELFSSPLNYSAAANIMCIDQDEEALNFSRQELAKVPNKNVNINLVQGNILHLDKMNIKNESMDMIYSIGIADYLQDRMLNKIFTDCLQYLKKDGKLIVAYKDIDVYRPLQLNWYSDWNFVSRNEEEFLSLIKEAMGEDNITIEVIREGSGVIFFAIITKL